MSRPRPGKPRRVAAVIIRDQSARRGCIPASWRSRTTPALLQHPRLRFREGPARLGVIGSIYNATDPDLTAFSDAGGKVLMWHGWADAIVTPQLTIDYYGQVEERMGGRDATRDFFRLFMIWAWTTAAFSRDPESRRPASTP
jgi:hypothetical protein